jgi:hypothetical protein
MSSLRSLGRTELAYRIVGVAGSWLIRGLHLGTKSEVEGGDLVRSARREGPVCFVFWHEQIVPLAHAHRGEGVAILASDHRDGEYISRILTRLSFVPIRGSSTRGGRKALRGMARAAEEGRDLALAPDGPRGPARRFPEEALGIARLTGVPVIPAAAGVFPAWRADRSWDRMIVPKPGARIRVAYGTPRVLDRRIDAGGVSAMATELGGELDRLTDDAETRARDAWTAARSGGRGWRPPA